VTTEWRVYSLSYADYPRLGVTHEVKAFLRWDEPVPVVENHVSPGRGGNERSKRAPRQVRDPHEIRAIYAWRHGQWVATRVTLVGRNPTLDHCEEREDCECGAELTVRVNPASTATPEPVRQFVAWATPTERPGTWVGYDADHGFYGRED